MSLKLVAIGQAHDPQLKTAIEGYQKRFQRLYRPEWVLLRSKAKNASQAINEEAELILKQLKPSDYLILLDEAGQQLDSPGLAKQLDQQLSYGRQVYFVIGGAYGVSSVVKARADFVWSLSKLVFPHQLVRLILTEQLYRAQEINAGRPYHHA